MSTHNLNQLFENQYDWDFEEPETGHEKRFLEKLNKQKPSKKKKLNCIPLSIAASLLLGFGIILFMVNNPTTEEVVLSPQVQETHDYFSSVIRNELTQLKNQETPQSKALITDAMKELESLEDDYHNLKVEIANNGENKQIIFAMLTNLQTRISFIKTVLEQVEEINNLNTLNDEKHI